MDKNIWGRIKEIIVPCQGTESTMMTFTKIKRVGEKAVTMMGQRNINSIWHILILRPPPYISKQVKMNETEAYE